jgi:hypothetical protein
MKARDKLLDEVPPGTTAGLTRWERLSALHSAIDAHIEDARNLFDKEDEYDDTDCDGVGTYLEIAVNLCRLMRETQRELEDERNAKALLPTG